MNNKMRSILVEWLIELNEEFKLTRDTLFKAVHIVDSYLSRTKLSVPRKSLQLVGTVSLFIASKYEDNSKISIYQLVEMTCGAYTKDQALAMEIEILNTLEFDIASPTPLHFFPRYCDVDTVLSDFAVRQLSIRILEVSLLTTETLTLKPSEVAAVAVYMARVSSGCAEEERWPPSLIHLSTYAESHILKLAISMTEFLNAVMRMSLQIVKTRYDEAPANGCCPSTHEQKLTTMITN